MEEYNIQRNIKKTVRWRQAAKDWKGRGETGRESEIKTGKMNIMTGRMRWRGSHF